MKKHKPPLVLKAIDGLVKRVGSLQAAIHDVNKQVARHAFVYGDANIVKIALDKYMAVNGTVRVNAIAYWFKHVAGINVNFNEKQGSFTAKFANNEYTSDLGIAFTYEKEHLNAVKDERFSYWLIAPKDVKELKALDNVSKVTAGVEAQYARGLVLGTITEEEVLKHLEGMMARIQTAKSSKATKEWINKFMAQASGPVVEEELTETEMAIRELELV